MHVIVVGAGIAGLGAATYLAAKGHEVEVLEASHRAGGRAMTITSQRGDRADVGAQYFHSNYRRAKALLRAVGLFNDLSVVRGKTRFFDDRVSHGYFDILHNAPWFPTAGLANLKAVPLIAKAFLNRFETFGLSAMPQLDEAAVAAAANDPVLREFVLRPLLLAGCLSEVEGMQTSVLNVLRLFRIVVLTKYLALPAGMSSFVEALVRKHRVRLGARVRRLIVEKNQVSGVELETTGDVIRADHVIVALPPPEAAALTPDDWTIERDLLRGFVIPPALNVTLFLDRPISGNVWSYVFQAARLKNFSFAIDAAKKNPTMAPSGKAIIQIWSCYPSSQSLLAWPDDQLIQQCLKEMEPWFPLLGSKIEESVVTRHPFGVPLHDVGHQQRALEFLSAVSRRRGVSYCGDYFSGGFMESALWSADFAVSRLPREATRA